MNLAARAHRYFSGKDFTKLYTLRVKKYIIFMEVMYK